MNATTLFKKTETQFYKIVANKKKEFLNLLNRRNLKKVSGRICGETISQNIRNLSQEKRHVLWAGGCG